MFIAQALVTTAMYGAILYWLIEEMAAAQAPRLAPAWLRASSTR